ncbi:MAG: hypothetical protein Q8L82_12340, partial [Nitrosomonas sp.]|nr:hypothetical protein [Nitrosomonas sp.]
ICEQPLCGLPAYPVSSPYFVAHKKYFLTYQSYAASIFFIRAWSCLELRIFRGALECFGDKVIRKQAGGSFNRKKFL